MDFVKKLPWWSWGIMIAIICILAAVLTGAADLAGGALAALVGSGVAAHKAGRKARRINKDLDARLAEERRAVEALNDSQASELESGTDPVSHPPDGPEDEAARRDAVRDPWK